MYLAWGCDSLTAALSVCNLEISVAGAKERLNNLYTYEAEKAVKVYRECRRSAREEAAKPLGCFLKSVDCKKLIFMI